MLKKSLTLKFCLFFITAFTSLQTFAAVDLASLIGTYYGKTGGLFSEECAVLILPQEPGVAGSLIKIFKDASKASELEPGDSFTYVYNAQFHATGIGAESLQITETSHDDTPDKIVSINLDNGQLKGISIEYEMFGGQGCSNLVKQ